MSDQDETSGTKAQRFHDWVMRQVAWAEKNVPPGLRSLLGVLCLIGGVFGFLPIVGFWMIPLGLALIFMDIKGLWRGIARLFRR